MSVRRSAVLALFALTLLAPALALADGASGAPGVAVLPPRARGLTPVEYRRLEAGLAATFHELRSDVVDPDDIAARLARDERQRAALVEARRLTAEGMEKARALEHAAAIDRYDRAVQTFREHFGEFADPDGLALAYIRRGAERLVINDATGARADFFNAVSVAPDDPPSLDDYPPPVLDAWRQARADRMRRPLPAEDTETLGALGGSLGVGTITTARAEKGDRPDDGIAVEVAVWSVTPRGATPIRTAHATLPIEGSWDPLAGAVRDAGAPIRVASVPLVAQNDGHVDPAGHNPARVPPRPPVRPGAPPLWKNKWVWAGAAVLAAGAVGYGVSSSQRTESKGYRVIVTPGS